MSAIANLGGAPAAFPPVNLHAHGHKRGGHVQATDDTGSDSSAQVPPGLRQNLFGSLLNSLEQVIGVQLTAPAATGSANASTTGSTHATTAGTTANAAAGGANAAASTAGAATASAQSSITLLQNYLSNLAHNSHTDGSPAAKSAGSGVSVSA